LVVVQLTHVVPAQHAEHFSRLMHDPLLPPPAQRSAIGACAGHTTSSNEGSRPSASSSSPVGKRAAKHQLPARGGSRPTRTGFTPPARGRGGGR
jgi:hypothetical protein